MGVNSWGEALAVPRSSPLYVNPAFYKETTTANRLKLAVT